MDNYRAYKYDMLIKNCNHFSNDFLGELFNGRYALPYYVNRAAWLGSWFHCIIPTRYVTVAPTGCEEEGAELMQKWNKEEETNTMITQESTRGSFID